MKIKKQTIFLFVFIWGTHILYSQHPTEVQKLSALRQSGSMLYYNGQPYTGEAIDFYGEKNDMANVKFHGFYQNGLPIRHIKKWYPNHKLAYDENYNIAGLKDGLQVYYYENGKANDSSRYSNGQLDGRQSKWYINGQKESEKNYFNGTPDGRWLNFTESGQLILQQTLQLGSLVSEIAWYTNGKKNKEKIYSKGIPSGKWTSYDENGLLLSEEEYEQGEIINKTIITRYANGKKATEKMYSKDLPVGKWKTFDEKEQVESEITYEAGTIVKTEYYKNNLPDGIWTTKEDQSIKKIAYQNGRKKSESKYVNNMPSGVQSEYMDDGRIKETIFDDFTGEKLSEGFLLNNKKDGKWMNWFERGEKIVEETYKDGVLAGSTTKIISRLVGFHRTNSIMFKLKDEKVFIRVDFNSYDTKYPSSDENRVAVSIKRNLMNLSNLVAVSPDGEYKDETLNYVIDISNIRVSFETFSGADIRLVGNANTVRTGFASTVEVMVNLKNTENITIESKSYKNTTKHVLMSIPYQTQNEALDAANEKGYIKKVIDKIVSIK